MLKWEVGDVVRYRIRLLEQEGDEETIREIKNNCLLGSLNMDGECISCCKLRIVLSNTRETMEGYGLCGGPKHCRLVRKTRRREQRITQRGLKLPTTKELVNLIGR